LATAWSAWWSDLWAVCQKEIRSELRTRYALNAIVLFAVTTVTVVGMATAQTGLGGRTQAALFWIVVFFSAMSALAQVFVKEEESGTALALKLSARSDAVFFGKLLFNLLLLATLQLLVTPLFVLLVGMEVFQWALFVQIIVLGTIGLAGATTIVAAMVARASVRGALFAVLSFPLLLPLLIAAIGGTQAALDPAGAASAASEIKLLSAYALAMVTGSWLLFDFVWWA
jgi:heme exporter protein B